MIVYGWNAKNIKQAPLENYECPQCQQKQSVLVIMAKYVHLFWIPVFPFKKSALIVCNNCRKETEEKSIALSAGVSVAQLKSTVPIPKYLFSGLAILIAAISYIVYLGIEEDKQEQAYIAAPAVGDVYIVKSAEETSQYNHILFKIREVHGDSVYISYSSFGYTGMITQLDPKDGFYDMMYSVHKDFLKKFDEKGELKKVFRGYSASAGFDQEVKFQLDSMGVEEENQESTAQ
jgi:transcription elongation factor Elf1